MTRKRLKWLFLAFAAALVALTALAVSRTRTTLRDSEIDALCQSLADRDPSVRDAAAARLAAIKDPAGIRRIAVNAGGRDYRVTRRLESILASMGAPAVKPICSVWRRAVRPASPAPSLWSDPPLSRWHARWLGLPEGLDVRAWAQVADTRLCYALARMGRPARPELLEMMADSDPEMRFRVRYVLGAMADPRNSRLFLQMLDDPDGKVAWAGARGLGALKAPEKFHAVGGHAEDADAWKEFEAARDEIIAALTRALDRKNTLAPAIAVSALAAYADSPAAAEAVLKTIYDTSRPASMRCGALTGIAGSTDPRVLKAFAEMAVDADQSVRSVAVGYLPQDDPTAARVVLLLDSTDAALRKGAHTYFAMTERPDVIHLIADAFPAFSSTGRAEAVAVLTAIERNNSFVSLDDPDVVRPYAALRQAALDALARIQPAAPDLDSSAPH